MAAFLALELGPVASAPKDGEEKETYGNKTTRHCVEKGKHAFE